MVDAHHGCVLHALIIYIPVLLLILAAGTYERRVGTGARCSSSSSGRPSAS